MNMSRQRSNAALVAVGIACALVAAVMGVEAREYSYIDSFDIGCDIKGTYQCKMFGIGFLNGTFIDLAVMPTMTIYGVQRLGFLMKMEYPNADPESATFDQTSTEEADDDDLNTVSIAPVSEEDGQGDLASRVIVVETAGARYSDDAMCTFELPFTAAEDAAASLDVTMHKAYCYEAMDASISLVRIIGEDCDTILMNSGEPAVSFEMDGASQLWPYSSTYECHKE